MKQTESGLWVTSHTEVNTLLVCEEQWRRKYLERETAAPPTAFMLQGRLIGAAVAAWYERMGSEGMVQAVGAALTTPEFAEVAVGDQFVQDTLWLIGRWVECYGDEPHPDWQCVGTEYHLEVPLALTANPDPMQPPVMEFGFQGYLDAAVIIDGDLWLVEVKASGDRNRADTALVEPQISDYCMAWEIENGTAPFGVIFDHVYTYRWKRDEHPPEDSFNRVFADRTPRQLSLARDEITSSVDRMLDLKEGIVHARHNVSNRVCNSCGYKAECWADLAFEPTPPTLELIEDE